MILTASPEIQIFMRNGRSQKKTVAVMKIQETVEIQKMETVTAVTIHRMEIILMKP